MLSTLQSCVLLFSIRLKLLILAWPVVRVEKRGWRPVSDETRLGTDFYFIFLIWNYSNKKSNWYNLMDSRCQESQIVEQLLSLHMQIYTWVPHGWRIKDHSWNMTCVWSSRPELRQRLERGTASISAGQGQVETWSPAVDALRKPGLEQCCGHWVGGLKGFS